jgi:hypothetical protein
MIDEEMISGELAVVAIDGTGDNVEITVAEASMDFAFGLA